MDGVNESDENGKISNLLDPDAKKQTFGGKSQNWPNLRDKNGILLKKNQTKKMRNLRVSCISSFPGVQNLLTCSSHIGNHLQRICPPKHCHNARSLLHVF
ncbi:hypothetical protein Hanom_Chr06g00566511 [Helianthus anomalus]